MKKADFRILGLIMIVMTNFQSFGQDVRIINKFSVPIEFDGNPFEEAWNGFEYFPLTMHRTNFGNAPSEDSELMITCDDEFLWIGARLYTKDAETIVAKSKKRDEQLRNSDSFGVLLDTYHINENALVF